VTGSTSSGTSIKQVRSHLHRFRLAVILAVDAARRNAALPSAKNHFRLPPLLLAGYALVQILWIVWLWFNHIPFPLNLEAMEMTVLQHVQRLLAGLPLYPEPSPDFVALAYNPLFYYLCLPFTWLFGATLPTIRFVAVLGMLGSGIMLFLIVRQVTQSPWWGLMATGLFAASYQALDTYTDNAHRDSWLLFSILLGCYLLDRNIAVYSLGSRLPRSIQPLPGIFLLITAFWFKQQGATFLLGGLLYLTWKVGWRQAWLAWGLGLLLVPGLYIAAPDWLFGEQFHYFTWQVPRQWIQPEKGELRLLLNLLAQYGFLLLAGSAIAIAKLRQRYVSIWIALLPIALLSGGIAFLTLGSNRNVYIPMVTWLILVGTIGLKDLADRAKARGKQANLAFLALTFSFLLLVYNPSPVIVSTEAKATYQDFVSYLRSLDGTVYIPFIGQIPEVPTVYPTAHWVPLNDMVRGAGRSDEDQPLIRSILSLVEQPPGNAYLIHHFPLEQDTMLKFLCKHYVLEADLGDRFQALGTLPKRYTLHQPRYVYRYRGRDVTYSPG
jgi:hypothetical protein